MPFNPERPAFISGGKALAPMDSAQAVQRGNGSSSVVDSEQVIRTPTEIVPGSFGDALVPPGTGAPAPPAPPVPPVVGVAGGLTPPANGSWSVGAWFVDPQNGSDANTGQTSSSPLKTWRALVALWGTVSPILAQNTTITFLSGHTDGTDPVVFWPIINGFLVEIVGTMTLVASTTLNVVTAKNTTTGQPLASSFAAGGAAVNQMVENTTAGKTSRAWLYANAGGGTFDITQPLALFSPSTFSPFTKVDTWAHGDTVKLWEPCHVNIVSVGATVDVYNSTLQPLVIYQCSCWDPVLNNFDPAQIGPHTSLVESRSDREANIETNATDSAIHVNALFPNALSADANASTNVMSFIGGGCGAGGSFFNRAVFEAGFVIYGGQAIGMNDVALEEVLIDAGSSFTMLHGLCHVRDDPSFGNALVWGTGTLNIDGTCAYPSAHTAVATFPISTLTLNNLTTANSQTSAAGTATIHTGIALTAANLDAAAGAAGFGGSAFILGGASINNTAV